MKKRISLFLAVMSVLTVMFCCPFSVSAAEVRLPNGAKTYGGYSNSVKR